MELFHYIKQRSWTTVAGYLLFVGMMATGYYYNVTFVQLGLVDLGQRLLGMDEQQVAVEMALLALITCIVALGMGLLSLRLRWASWWASSLLACS
jgi:hypothetical protein